MEPLCQACWERCKIFFYKIYWTWNEYTSDGEHVQCPVAQSIHKLLTELCDIFSTKERQSIDRRELIPKVDKLKRTLESFYQLYE
jgi:hypothetical protein